MKKVSVAVFVLSCLAFLAQALYYWPLLPDTVASHFDLHGRPDGWTSRSSYAYFGVEFTVGLVCAAVGLLPAWVTSKVLAQVTDALGEKGRLSPTLAQDVRDYILVQSLWLASILMLTMADLFWQSSRLNVEHLPALDHLYLNLGVLIGVGLGWPLVLLVGAVFLFRRRRSSRPVTAGQA